MQQITRRQKTVDDMVQLMHFLTAFSRQEKLLKEGEEEKKSDGEHGSKKGKDGVILKIFY